MYAGDEIYDDDATSGVAPEDPPEVWCRRCDEPSEVTVAGEAYCLRHAPQSRVPVSRATARRLAAATSETEREAILTGGGPYDALLARVVARRPEGQEWDRCTGLGDTCTLTIHHDGPCARESVR